MSARKGEVSEVNNLDPDSAPHLGDVSPPAEVTDQVAQGEPRDYSGDRPEEADSLRSGANETEARQAPPGQA